LEDLGEEGRIMLKWISRKWVGRAWNGFSRLRTEISGGLL